LTLRAPQWTIFRCRKRYRVLVAGRRFGKTQLALVELCQAAWKEGRLAWYVAPTYKQAKRVAWNGFRQMTRPYWAGGPRETDLSIESSRGGTIALRGADNYDGLRGDGLDFLVLDEYGNTQDQIASVLGQSSRTLRKYFRDELDRGATEANSQIAHALFKKAKDEDTTAQIFWLKCQAGWRERGGFEPSSAPAAPFLVSLERGQA